MKKIFLKIWNVISNRVKKYKEKHKFKRQSQNTIKLRDKKASDIDRWKKSEELYEDWNKRTKILAALIDKGSNVIEFGAGNMVLKEFLPPKCTYTPSDIIKRSEKHLVCDLNKGINFDLSIYDTAVFSGVLEYVYDVEQVFIHLSGFIDNIILSYACKDISNADRLKSGWLSDYRKEDLEIIFNKYRYSIIDYQEWRNQSIFKLKKNELKVF